MPLTTIEAINCADLSAWNKNRGYGDGTPPLTLRFKTIVSYASSLHINSSPWQYNKERNECREEVKDADGDGTGRERGGAEVSNHERSVRSSMNIMWWIALFWEIIGSFRGCRAEMGGVEKRAEFLGGLWSFSGRWLGVWGPKGSVDWIAGPRNVAVLKYDEEFAAGGSTCIFEHVVCRYKAAICAPFLRMSDP